jgi:hypothetical protein
LQLAQNLGINVTIGKTKGGQVDRISIVAFIIKTFDHN